MKIEYTSDNGLKGVLYGKRSLSIYNSKGREIFHTGFRNINTYEELKETVDTFTEFLETLKENKK